jgi:hypothetical protein
VHDAVLEDERGHADGIQPVRKIDAYAFMGNPEFTNSRYSYRSACVGEIRDARRAGT